VTIKCPECDALNPDTATFCADCGTRLPSLEGPVPTKTLERPGEELTTGSIFGTRYQIIEELGRGGMGKVYRALDKELGEEVALKLIKPEIATHLRTIERFKSEIRIARRILHKNVGRVYELMEDKGVRFITMEYIPGENLKSLIRRIKQLTVGTVISIARQICKGLAEAHKLGIVHRDLKPSNIMIDKEGNVRIMDFGIARSVGSEGITETGTAIGTPEYMSPEQVEGLGIDQRSDIYSLGVILYEMVTGDVPFKGNTPFSVALKHKTESPREPRALNEQVSEDFNRVILKCMEKDKTQRYQSAEEVDADLAKLEQGIPMTEGPHPRRKKERFSFFKSRWVIAAAGTLLLAAILIVGYLLLNKGKIGSEPEKPVPPVAALKSQEKEESPPPAEKVTEKEKQEPQTGTKPEQTEQKKTETKRDEEKKAAVSDRQETKAVTKQTGNLEIRSEPPEADVYLDEEQVGQTPFKKEVSPGTHSVRIAKYPEYKDITEEVEVRRNMTFSKTYVLTPLYLLEIDTDPAGADVIIDGQLKGKTPLRVEWLRSSCRLQIEMEEGWTAVDESLTLKRGLNPIQRTLEKKEYTVMIRTQPSNATVSIDDRGIGSSPLQTLLPHGKHEIRIEKEGYKTLSDSISVDSELEKTYELNRIEKVNIRIIVQPFATVLLDGLAIGDVPPIKSLEIDEGKHTIVFINEKLNKKISKEFEITPGEDMDLRMNMTTEEFRIVKKID
jgi:serine/threonine protein kinase